LLGISGLVHVMMANILSEKKELRDISVLPFLIPF
jgi:hypothetical protein